MKKLVKRVLAIALSIAMVLTSMTFYSPEVKAEKSTTGTKLSSGTNQTLNSGTYYLSENVTFTPSETGSSGLSIASGATVKIYLNGFSLTSSGSKATDGTAGGTGSRPGASSGATANGGTAGTAGTKGYAGIKLPADATLIFIGSGTVNATGGNAGNGGAGGTGGSGRVTESGSDYVMPGSGGGGGGAGGGAGAGIGTDGSDGSAGTAGATATSKRASTPDALGNPAYPSASTASAGTASSGKLFVYQDSQNAITINATGGSAGSAPTTAANGGTNGTDKNSGWEHSYTAAGGAGGGAGGSGGAGMNIGAGGTGGTGGTGGSSGGTDYSDSIYEFRIGEAGQAGKGGNNAGKAGVNGKNSQGNTCYDIDGDITGITVYYSTIGTAVNAADAGTQGSAGTVKNLYYTGVYAKLNNAEKVYKVDDYVNENDLDVYLVYNVSTDATIDPDKTVDTYYDSSMTDYDKSTNTGGYWSRKVTTDEFFIKGAEKDGEHKGELKITAELAETFLNNGTDTKPEGLIKVTLDDTMVSTDKSTGIVGDPHFNINEKESTEGTDKGTDSTKQDDLYDYPTEGNAAKFNELPAVKTMYYDGESHTIAELIRNSGYGFNNGEGSEYTITDQFFKNGLDATTSESTYWLAKYARAPYYRVNYQAYYPSSDDDSGKYITGNSEGVVIEGKTESSPYYEQGQISTELIKDAGYYTIDVVVPYRYRTYRHFRGWSAYNYYYRTYKFNILVRKADLEVHAATDTVHENTKVQNHTFTSNVVGQNEDVYGEFLYSSSVQGWSNNEARSANEFTDIIQGITWEFNVYHDHDKNNYLCQIDGPMTGNELNSYYSGENGVLIYSPNDIGTRKTDMSLYVKYEGDQSEDGTRTEEDFDSANIEQSDEGMGIQSVYAEKLSLSAFATPEYTSLGYKVAVGDYVNGESTMGTKITDNSSLPDAYKQYFRDLVRRDRYRGDKFIVNIKAGNTTVFTQTVDAEGTDDYSMMLDVVSDQLPACEYYGIEAYDVDVDYIGLYYTSETTAKGRQSDWSGEEEFNWVTAHNSFKIDVEQREIKLNPLDDIDKTYDGTDLVVSQQKNNTGDVTRASGYVINVRTNMRYPNQTNKAGTTAFFNYYDTSENSVGSMTLEISGNYDSKNKGIEKEVTINSARISRSRNNTYLNYRLVDLPATLSGKVGVANMYFTHEQFGTMQVFDTTPMADILGISVKAYQLHTELDKDGFVVAANTTFDELVEGNDARANQIKPVGNDVLDDIESDYEALYFLQTNEYSPDVLYIDYRTGAITQVATSTKGGNNASQFPTVVVAIGTYPNFTCITQTEDTEVDIYGTCETGEANDYENDNEFVVHPLRYRIIGNQNTYDVILPTNQINNGGNDSSFIDKYADSLVNGDEIYEYMTVYEEGDETTFKFTVPQDSYLEDLAIVDLGDYKTYGTEPISTFADIQAKLKDNSLGTFNTQEETLNANENPLYLTLDEIDGYEFNELLEPDDQIGGLTFTFTLKTGNSVLGNNKALAIVPIWKQYKLLNDEFKSDVKVEKTYDEEGSVVDGTDDSVYVNYMTDFHTNSYDYADDETWATINMSYNLDEETTESIKVPLDSSEKGLQSIEIQTEDEAYSEFFSPDKLLPGTEVTTTIKVWREGDNEGIDYIDESDDPDAFDEVTLKWTVSVEDYERLFNDEGVFFRTSNSVKSVDNIKAFAIYDDDEVANVEFGNIPQLIEKQEDGTWLYLEDVNMLDIADTWYLTGEDDGTRVVIANDSNNNYPIKKVGEEQQNYVPLGSSFYPTYEIAELYRVDVDIMDFDPMQISNPIYARVLFGEVDLYGNVTIALNKELLEKVTPYKAPTYHIPVDFESIKPYTSFGWSYDNALLEPIVDDGNAVEANAGDKFYYALTKMYVTYVVGEKEVGYSYYEFAYPYITNLTKALFITEKPKQGFDFDYTVKDMSKYKVDNYIEGGWYYDKDFKYPVEDFENVKLSLEDEEWDDIFYLKPIPVEEVQVKDIEMYIGDSTNVEVTVLPEDAFDKSVEYVIDDPEIATIDEEGKVTANKIGATTLKVIAKDYGTVIGEAQITVNPILVDKVELTGTEELFIGDSQQFEAKVTPDNATDKTITWKSSDDDVATVDEEGKVTAISAGTVEISATANDEGHAAGVITLTVKPRLVEKVEVTGVGKIAIGETKEFTAKVTPDNATDATVTWKSSDEKVATVDDKGNVKGIAYGKVNITATANDGSGVVGTVSLDVGDKPITPEDIAANSFEINKGIKATASSTGITVEWNKVKDAEEYVVYAQICSKKFGKGSKMTVGKDISKIKFKKVNGKKISNKKNYKVVVKAYKTINGKRTMIAKSITGHFVSSKHKKYSNPAKIKLKKTSFTLSVGKKAKIKGKVKLQKKKRKMLSSKHAPTFRFSSGNTSVAKVSKKGTITAVGKGNTTIYVYAKNGLPKAVKVTVR